MQGTFPEIGTMDHESGTMDRQPTSHKYSGSCDAESLRRAAAQLGTAATALGAVLACEIA